jgi:hypothetical protein
MAWMCRTSATPQRIRIARYSSSPIDALIDIKVRCWRAAKSQSGSPSTPSPTCASPQSSRSGGARAGTITAPMPGLKQPDCKSLILVTASKSHPRRQIL